MTINAKKNCSEHFVRLEVEDKANITTGEIVEDGFIALIPFEEYKPSYLFFDITGTYCQANLNIPQYHDKLRWFKAFSTVT
jgi:hypothetical protein